MGDDEKTLILTFSLSLQASLAAAERVALAPRGGKAREQDLALTSSVARRAHAARRGKVVAPIPKVPRPRFRVGGVCKGSQFTVEGERCVIRS